MSAGYHFFLFPHNHYLSGEGRLVGYYAIHYNLGMFERHESVRTHTYVYVQER